jgi:hypothetical protein
VGEGVSKCSSTCNAARSIKSISNSYDTGARFTWSGMLSDSFLSQVHPHEGGRVTRVARLGSASSLVHHHLQLLVALGQQCLHPTLKSVISATSQMILKQVMSKCASVVLPFQMHGNRATMHFKGPQCSSQSLSVTAGTCPCSAAPSDSEQLSA